MVFINLYFSSKPTVNKLLNRIKRHSTQIPILSVTRCFYVCILPLIHLFSEIYIIVLHLYQQRQVYTTMLYDLQHYFRQIIRKSHLQK